MTTGVALLLTFIAAALSAFVAADVPDFPQWADAVLCAVIAGLAGVGIPAVARNSTTTRRRETP